jgi:hypothetical protein
MYISVIIPTLQASLIHNMIMLWQHEQLAEMKPQLSVSMFGVLIVEGGCLPIGIGVTGNRWSLSVGVKGEGQANLWTFEMRGRFLQSK